MMLELNIHDDPLKVCQFYGWRSLIYGPFATAAGIKWVKLALLVFAG